MNTAQTNGTRDRKPLDWDTAKKFEDGDFVVVIKRARHEKGYYLYSVSTGVKRPNGESRPGIPVYFNLESFNGGTPKLQHDFVEVLGRLLNEAKEYILNEKAQAMALRKRADNGPSSKQCPPTFRAGKTERDRNKHRAKS